jgi:hypothetical protein
MPTRAIADAVRTITKIAVVQPADFRQPVDDRIIRMEHSASAAENFPGDAIVENVVLVLKDLRILSKQAFGG